MREGDEIPAAEEFSTVMRKIEEILPEVEWKGYITGWRGGTDGEIDEIFMDPLAKLIAARVCRKFVTEGEIAIYAALEMPAWRKLSELTSEPYQARSTRASHI